MKAKITLLLIFIYLFTNVNTILASHTCSGNVYAISAITKAKKCDFCQKTTKKGCCKDKSKIVKITDKHAKSDTDFQFGCVYFNTFLKNIYLPKYFKFVTSSSFFVSTNLFFYSLKKHIFYCIFLI